MSGHQEQVRRELSAYLDGELPPEEAERLARWLRSDPLLSRELSALRAVREMLKDLPRARAPETLAEKVLARVERDSVLEDVGRTRRRHAGWWLGRLATAAAALIVVGIGVGVVAWLRMPSYVDRMARRGGGQHDLSMSPAAARGPETTPPAGDRSMASAGPAAPTEALASAEPVSFFINTDNLEVARAEVEHVLRSNRVLPTSPPAGVEARPARAPGRVRVNQIRYEVVIDESRLRRIVSELNAIRANQKVAQVPLRKEWLRPAPRVGARSPTLALGEKVGADASASPPARAGNRVDKTLARGAAGAPAAARPAAAAPGGVADSGRAESSTWRRSLQESIALAEGSLAPAGRKERGECAPGTRSRMVRHLASSGRPDAFSAKVGVSVAGANESLWGPPNVPTFQWRVQDEYLKSANVRQLVVILNGVTAAAVGE